MTRANRVVARVALVAVALTAAAASCGERETATPAGPAPTVPAPTAAVPTPAGPAVLRGRPLTGEVGLRLLVEGRRIAVDGGRSERTSVTAWLPAAGHPPILVEEVPLAEFGATRITARPASRADEALPGPAVRVHRATTTGLAASADGRGVWASEYRDRSTCQVRELGLDGRARRAPFPVPCGTDVLAETAAGLWVERWRSLYTLDGHMATSTSLREETTVALLDPATGRERAAHAEARVAGAAHLLTMNDEESDLALVDTRTGAAVAMPSPSPLTLWGFGTRLVSEVSPDGRYAMFRFSDHGTAPQVLDLWIVDLTAGTWLHPPGLPAYAGLKYTSEAWAPDGRLVIVGDFPEVGSVIAVWRPGEAALSLRPFPLAKEIYDQGLGDILVW
jgi:hypothetical protein